MYTMLPDQTLTRALCCDCGQLRTVKRNHCPRRFMPEVGALYVMSDKGRRLYPFAQPGDRYVGDLKCGHCGTTTRHAFLRDGDEEYAADYAELKNYGRAR